MYIAIKKQNSKIVGGISSVGIPVDLAADFELIYDF